MWAQGESARLTDFGHRLLWAELRARKRLQPHIEALRADLERVVAEARDEREQLLTVCASHDLALPRLREHAAQRSVKLSLDMRIQGSIDSVRSLNAGRCLVAGFHVPALSGAAPIFAKALKPLLRPGLHKLIGCSRRTQGLMMRKEHADAVLAVGDLPGSRLRFVNRQVGSGTRLLMDHLLHEHGLKPRDVAGYENAIEESHVAVATCVASGIADVGPVSKRRRSSSGSTSSRSSPRTTSSPASSPTWSTRRCCVCASFWRAMPGRAFSSRSRATPARVRRAPSSA